MVAAIRLVDICRQYQLGNTDVNALNNINLEIDQGDFVALVGPSGSGKSTLLNLLGGLDKPTSGEISVQDLVLQDATEIELTAHRRHNVGFIFQTFNLIPTLTALENVALPLMLSGVALAERCERARQLLKRVGLDHRLDHRPTEMSGGEQQRAAIARALVNEPNIILADEPTGNLDSSIGSEVMRLLRELNHERGVTLIVVTHDPEVASFANRVVHLRDGEIKEIETTGKDLSKSGKRISTESPSALSLEGKISFRDLTRTAYENLSRRPVRNLLTAAGVLIGIVTLVAMVSFGVGVQAEVNRNFQALGLENVFVSPSFPEEEDAFDPFGLAQPDQPLTPDIVAEFRAMPAVQSVTPTLNLPSNIEISLTYGENEVPIRLSRDFGNDRPGPGGPDFLTPPEMLAGSPLGEGDTQGVVLIDGLADQLIEGSDLDYEDLIDDTATLIVRLPRGETKEFTSMISGVRQGRGSQTIDLGINERTAIKAWWYGRPDTLSTDGYDLLIIKAIDDKAVSSILETAGTMDLEAQSLGTILELANRVLAILQALLGSVGALALLVATLGVANTMMMAIYERTKEIGILKARGPPYVHRGCRASRINRWHCRSDIGYFIRSSGGLGRAPIPGL
jgi:ABC-type lipoprotein export system ATPase subunit